MRALSKPFYYARQPEQAPYDAPYKRHLLTPDYSNKTVQQALSLIFSSSTSILNLQEFFNSKRREDADPDQFVKQRPFHTIVNLAYQSRIAMIEDQDNRIQALCVAYRYDISQTPQTQEYVTEMGTLVSCMKGLGLSKYTMSALSQSIRAKEGDSHQIIAKVDPTNRAANKFMETTLGWDSVTNPQKIKAFYNSEMGKSARHEDRSDLKNWYSYGQKAQSKAKAEIESVRNSGFITDKNDNHICFSL